MSRPRWLRSSRRSWERIGFLKLAVIFASRGSTPADFVEEIRKHINSIVNVPYSEPLVRWLYSNGLADTKKLEEKATKRDFANLRLQYWWAFNNPIQTGWLSREAIPEYFGVFPRKIGVLEDNFDLSELGRTLALGFISNNEMNDLEGRSLSTLSPLHLTQSQKVFFIYSVLKADGDFMIPLLEQLVDSYSETEFTYLDAGQVVPPALDKMATQFRGSAYSTDDQYEISEIERVRDLVIEQNRIKIEKRGAGSRRDQVSVPRLEWLTDLGILQRERARSYRFTKHGLILAKQLSTYYGSLLSQYYPEDCLSKLLNQQLFGPIIEFLCGNAKRARPHEHLSLLREAYKVVEGSLGYVLIRSLLLIIHGWQADKRVPSYMEYADALEAVEAEYKKDPLSTYYTVDRLGDEHQVKFTL